MNPALSAFRFYLAISVLVSHFGGPDIWGDGGVEAFFCISGFLVTYIVSEKYRGRPLAYLLNRFLRIYPTYWACLLLSAVTIAAFPSAAPVVNKAMHLPSAIGQLIPQLTIFGLYARHSVAVRMLPPAWSLNVELYFYFVIGLLTAARPRVTMLLCAVSLIVCVLSAAGIVPLPYYGDPVGNAQPFFLGSLAYHLQKRYRPTKGMTALFFTAFLVVHLFPSSRFLAERIILESLLAPLAIVGIWNMDFGFNGRTERFLDLLGKLSYPIFLLHWVVAVPYAALGLHRTAEFALVLPTVIGVSYLVYVLVEAPIEKVRRAIRQARDTPQPVAAT